MNSQVLVTTSSKNYELLDSGDALKLERYGEYVIVRPDPQALWKKGLPETTWKKADAIFADKKWNVRSGVEIPMEWPVSFDTCTLFARLTPFKHTCIFPEQLPQWQWTQSLIKHRLNELKEKNRSTPIKVLNLFGYTGGATVAALKAGAEVVHVDGSKGAIEWAKENCKLSEIEMGQSADVSKEEVEKDIGKMKVKNARFILDDVRKFLARELKRGNTYHGIIMDPPAYGHGAKREIWNIETDFLPLVEDVLQILHKEEPLFLLINGYSAGYSALTYKAALSGIYKRFGGTLEAGELAIEESGPLKRPLPAGIFARWSKI